MTASTSKCARTDATYGAALVASLRWTYPRLTRRGLAMLLGISTRHLRKIEYARKELDLPLQLLLESKLDPMFVRDLRARFKPAPLPYWLALIEGKHHAKP